jgi:hypothetical protein
LIVCDLWQVTPRLFAVIGAVVAFSPVVAMVMPSMKPEVAVILLSTIILVLLLMLMGAVSRKPVTTESESATLT